MDPIPSAPGAEAKAEAKALAVADTKADTVAEAVADRTFLDHWGAGAGSGIVFSGQKFCWPAPMFNINLLR